MRSNDSSASERGQRARVPASPFQRSAAPRGVRSEAPHVSQSAVRGPAGVLPDEPARLQKVLSRAGVASRRHAEAMIESGRVRVNGRVVTELGTRVDPNRDEISVDGHRVSLGTSHAYLALNKPSGHVTTAYDPEGRPTVMGLVPDVPGLYPVGRLDFNTEGLLLLTTDGDWAQRVAHPRYGSQKEYLVEVAGRVTPSTLARLRAPLDLGDGERSTGSEVTLEGQATGRSLLRMVLHEGRNRQVRRMLEAVGHDVMRLVRVRVGAVELGTLRPGQWRHLTHAEIAATAGGEVPAEELPLPAGVRRRIGATSRDDDGRRTDDGRGGRRSSSVIRRSGPIVARARKRPA